MMTLEMLFELEKDELILLDKAEAHGNRAAYYAVLGEADKARSHARLAASHARRANAVTKQLDVWFDMDLMSRRAA